MDQPDEISLHLCEIARLLEIWGYGVEVDYTGATIIVWTDNWPVIVKVKNRRQAESEQEE